MSLHIGTIAPDFEQDSTQGRIRFHEWLGQSLLALRDPEELVRRFPKGYRAIRFSLWRRRVTPG
jgi:hypothetical protein